MSLKQTLASLALRPAMAVERALRGPHFKTPCAEVRSVLILEYMVPLGCCVHLTPLYGAIRESRPEAVITVATRGLGAALLRHHPYIDHLIETPDPLRDLPGSAKVLRRELNSRGISPECVLTGVSDQRTRIGLLAAMAGRGWRGGFTQTPALYRTPLLVDRGLSQIENNLRLAALLGCDDAHREPRVFFSTADIVASRRLVEEANPRGLPLVVMVTQSSGGQRTGWHNDRFAKVIRYIDAELGCAVAYVGTKAEIQAIETLRETAGGIGTSFAGRTSPTELAALLAMSDYAVSLDTGTMHVGRTVGVPMVVLGPSWQRPTEWLPLGLPHVRILRGPDRDDIPTGYRLDEIEAHDVTAALADLFTHYPPSQAERNTRVKRSTSHVDRLAPPGQG